ncbi:Gfo/Idh/MocA family oxidoreductase [bacterium]|nr:Gfo/Idh/MocA family oxidoreductase [bacterium]
MKILIVGLGSIARKHLQVLQELLSEPKIFALRSTHGGEDVEGVRNIVSWEEVPEDLGFVMITNPTGLHASAIEHALALNCPLFIEKPVLMRPEQAGSLLPKIQEKSTQTYVACNLRFLDCIQFVREYITQNNPTINEVSLYCGSHLPDWRQGEDFRKSYSADPERGGGVALDLIHELDYLYWVFGKPLQFSSTTRNQSSLNIKASDFAHYVCVYPGFTAMVTLNYYRRDPLRTFELVFEDKTWKVDLLKNTVTQGEEVIFESEQRITDTYKTQMEYFLSCISSNSRCMNDFEEALDVLTFSLS